MLKILLIIILLMPLSEKKWQKKACKMRKFEIRQDTCYDYSIETIKKWESFRPKKYKLFGLNYIGYGHLLTKKDTISILNEYQADSLLKNDFDKALKISKMDTLRLPNEKNMLVAMFVFNCGIGTFKRSKLLKLIKSRTNDSIIEKQYLGYVFANGQKIPKLKLRRIDEFKLWKLCQ